MGQGGGSTTFDQGRSKTTGQNTVNASTNTDRNATFRPEANGVLKALGGNLQDAGSYGSGAASYYQSQLQEGGVNPNVERVIAAQRPIADKQFGDRLAQVRSGGFRGGVGRDTINQGQFASDFTNQQNLGEAQMLNDAWNQQTQNKQGAASGLAGLDSQRLSAALGFLQSLRGEQASGTSRQVEDMLQYNKNQKKTDSIWGSGGVGN